MHLEPSIKLKEPSALTPFPAERMGLFVLDTTCPACSSVIYKYVGPSPCSPYTRAMEGSQALGTIKHSWLLVYPVVFKFLEAAFSKLKREQTATEE